MDRIYANIQTPLYGNNGSVGLLNTDTMIPNNTVNAAVGARTILREAAKPEYCPLLKFQPISSRQRPRILCVFGRTKQFVAVFDLGTEGLNKSALYDMNREICDVYSNLISFELLSGVNRSAATAKWVKNNIAVV